MWKPEPTQQIRTLKRHVGYGDYYMDAEELETEHMEVDKHVDKR